MTNDEAALHCARVINKRLNEGTWPGGEGQKIAAIQVIVRETLDAEALAYKPPVAGYTSQSDEKIALVNEFKRDEERLLRKLDKLVHRGPGGGPNGSLVYIKGNGTGDQGEVPVYDQRWLAIARTHFQEGFMALNRAVFQPQRIKLPEDDASGDVPPGRLYGETGECW